MNPGDELDAETLYSSAGAPGLRRAGGFVNEERLSKLQGSQGARVYREMGDNDPVVGAFLYVIEMLCRSVEWRMEPADDSLEAREEAEFVDSCRLDMSHSWQHWIAEALSAIQYGWAYSEIIYKVRRGPNETDGKFRSRHSDGRIGWRKLDLRAQTSLLRWEYDDEQSIRGLWQLPQDIYKTCFVPIEKALLIRIKAPLNNPEGRSLLRNAYRPWYFSKRIEEIEAIGIERDLCGLPIATVPPEALTRDASPSQVQLVGKLKTMVQEVRRNEREGMVLPAAEVANKDGTTVKTGYGFALLSSGGSRQIQPDVAIRRHQSRMAMTLLCEWMMLGVDKTGSFALMSEKKDLFATALGAILDCISDVMNTFGIPRLMTLNAVPEQLWPRLMHADIANVDITMVAAALNQLVGAQLLTPDESLERKLREMFELPQLDLTERPIATAPVVPGAALVAPTPGIIPVAAA